MMKLKHEEAYYQTSFFKWRQRIGFGISDYACNLAYLLTNTYLLFYYTNCAGISASAAGFMFVVTKVIDAVTDYLVGTWIDRTDTKMGRYRPWMLYGAPVLAFGMVILFSVPVTWADGAKLAWAYVSYIIFSFGYTLVNIPMTPIVTSLSPDPVERTNIVTTKQLLASLGSLTSSIFVLPMVQFFSGSADATGSQLAAGYRMTNVVLGAMVIILMIICVMNIEEINPPTIAKDANGEKQKSSIIADMKGIMKNQYYIMFIFFVFFHFMGYLVLYAAIQYYFTYVVGSTAAMSISMSIMTIVPMPMMVLSSWLNSRGVGKGTLLKTGSLIAAAGLLLMLVLHSIPGTLVCLTIWSIGFGLKQNILFATFPDIFDYTEYQVGKSLAGTQYSVASFCCKVASALASAMVSGLLVWGAYNAEALDAMLSAGKTVADLAAAYPQTITAIKLAFIGVSVATNLICTGALIPYKLDKLYPSIRAELDKRNAA